MSTEAVKKRWQRLRERLKAAPKWARLLAAPED